MIAFVVVFCWGGVRARNHRSLQVLHIALGREGTEKGGRRRRRELRYREVEHVAAGGCARDGNDFPTLAQSACAQEVAERGWTHCQAAYGPQPLSLHHRHDGLHEV